MASWITLIAFLAMTSVVCLAQTENDGAVFLSPLIAAGQIDTAKSLSRVSWDFVNKVDETQLESYAGYITVDETYGSNMFFWFFPAKENAATAPVLLWLNGGPGESSVFGALVENGPLKITKTSRVVESEWSWTNAFSMLYVDNPVGVGYSYAANPAGLTNTVEEMMPHLYSVLVQFFTLFTEYSQNDLYIGGQGFACQYISALGKYIHDQNHATPPPSLLLPLKGAYFGTGYCNGAVMETEAYKSLYYFGLISDYTRRTYSAVVANVVNRSLSTGRFEWIDVAEMLTGTDGVTDNADMSNMLGGEHTTFRQEFYLNVLLSSPTVREALHVGQANGNSAFESFGMDTWDRLRTPNWFRNANEENVFLMENYKVLHYAGNLDLTVTVAGTEKFLLQLQWTGADRYRDSIRLPWFKDDESLLGWVAQIGNFTRVVVRNSGHHVPHDQPEGSFLLMKNFVLGQPFVTEKSEPVD